MTLVVYMGIARVAPLQASLLAAGLAPSTPVLVVENASLPRERQLRTRLDRLVEDVAAQEISSPAIMVIGEVAREKDDAQSKKANVLVSMLSRGGASGGVLGSSNAL
jgi:uroporphyrin-III C-methyltransferase